MRRGTREGQEEKERRDKKKRIEGKIETKLF